MSEAHYTSCGSLVDAWAMQSCAFLVDDVALIPLLAVFRHRQNESAMCSLLYLETALDAR